MATSSIDKLTRADLEKYLAQKYQTPADKSNRVFQLAWEYGHSAGNHEVEYYYMDLASLVK